VDEEKVEEARNTSENAHVCDDGKLCFFSSTV